VVSVRARPFIPALLAPTSQSAVTRTQLLAAVAEQADLSNTDAKRIEIA
jgi:hypothetical protein